MILIVLTSNTNTVDVIRNDALLVHDIIQLGTGAMYDDRVQSNTVEEAKTESKFIEIVENSTADFDDSKLCRMGGV